jgi:hypothetical protein
MRVQTLLSMAGLVLEVLLALSSLVAAIRFEQGQRHELYSPPDASGRILDGVWS